MEYLRQLEADDSQGDRKGCFLCAAAETEPATAEATEMLLLHRTEHALMMLNRYPYTNGHLLVAPREHASELTDLSATVRSEMMELVTLADQLLRRAMEPQGLNIGMNLGRCAGAGLPGHLHAHIVPRWGGDTNFMMVTGAVRVVPDALAKSFELLRATLDEMRREST